MVSASSTKRREKMKRFVIFGTIEYIDHTALIHTVLSAEHIADADIEARAIALDNCDWLAPHYYDGKIMFVQYHEEE
jgi:hypothetical protein